MVNMKAFTIQLGFSSKYRLIEKNCVTSLPQEESSLPTNHPLLRCDNLRIRVNAGGAKWSWSSLLWKFTFLHKGRVFTYWRMGLRMTSLFWFCERLLSDHYFKLKRNPVCAFVVLEFVGIKKGSRPQLIIITICKWTFRTSKAAKWFFDTSKVWNVVRLFLCNFSPNPAVGDLRATITATLRLFATEDGHFFLQKCIYRCISKKSSPKII